MSKKKRWFQKGSWGGAEIDETKYSNTLKQHSEKLKQQKLIDEDGFEILPEDDYSDYGYSSRNWDFDKKLLDNPTDEKDKKKKYQAVKSTYYRSVETYEKTGVWGGYYKTPKLTYKYVQQMASALSAMHGIKIQIGNGWNVDLLRKTLTYNPASLIYGTKAELLATLMHEIGKLRYVTHSSMLKNKYLSMYDQPAKEVLSIYEDLRTDYLMLKAYESAAEIYESIIPTIETQVKGYMDYGEAVRGLTAQIPRRVYDDIVVRHRQSNNDGSPNPNGQKELEKELFRTFGLATEEQVENALKRLEEETEMTGTIYEWCGEMLSVMYDLDEQGHKKFPNVSKKMPLTIDTIDPSKTTADSQALVEFLDKETYPVIEDLLKDAKEKRDAIDKAFPNMSENVKQQMANMIQQNLDYQGGTANGVNVDKQGNTKSRSSSESDSTIPPEWESGDYKVLKDSVSMEIKQLIARLTFLRREELTTRFEADQKRGKLNFKKLYKISHGSRRLFKKKLENTDTIRSFAFSVLLDVSGSMNGSRITHCTRALITLSEVFKKMQIPFELTTFSDGAKNIKPFGAEMNGAMEKKIGGLVRHNGGGTNLNRGLDELKIHAQTEKNKIVIVLSDGGVGNMEYYDNNYFIPWAKKNVKTIGIGIECGNEMDRMAQGTGRSLKSASELPEEFSRILKTLIKRK